jgi:tetratricopeptide (TPR) repeat protein
LYKQALLDLSNIDSSAEAQILTEQILAEQIQSLSTNPISSGVSSQIVEKGLFDNANQQYTKLVYDGLKKMAGQQFQQAIIDFTSAIKIKSDIAEAYFHRGEAKHKLADFSDSVKDFMETLHINRGHPKVQVLEIQAIKVKR